MALRLFNTMGRTMQDFVPVHENHVGFYGCGPTVYNYAHIGNLRAYVFLDILDKTLSYLGYDITHVMNITDVGHLTGDSDEGDDKMVKSAAERHQSVLEVAQFYTDAFMKDIDALNIRHPDVICKATEHINEMIELIKKLEANGHTYMAGGNLYYDISTYPDYGKLANLDLDKLIAGKGKRKEVVIDENKRNPGDFVLWFTKSKFENQAMTWDSPWGRGYPGWHIECSAMSMKYLGKHIDIHTGGIDHVPVHHTNEIAQSEGSFSEEERKEGPWVKYWLHNEFLILEGGKMSKSSGHFITLQTDLPAEKGFSLTSKGFAPLDYRFFLLGGHYRKPLIFSIDALESAKNGRAALNERVAKLVKKCLEEEKIELTKENYAEILGKIASSIEESENIKRFREGLENDLATPVALSALQKASNGKNQKASEALADIFTMDKVISLSVIENAIAIAKKQAEEAKAHSDDHAGDPEATEITALVEERSAAKKAKDFARADQIRNDLAARGITIIDTPQGPTWKRN
ncbi:MAG: cysteine--tRNA ligase [Treponema sp.]|uniref:cysteine--tRNA ligase n=1 Tax=Treponema sp. TaxID=166 RepID=UPI0025F38C45|nr:cysteine--tRNA ligase [Treponema sp.]MBQ8678928.1 cysteine--tRNA ligase [Treponema sp.]